MFWSACHGGDGELVARELAAGLDARYGDSIGITPLMIGLDSGVDGGLLEALARASDLFAADDSGEGAVHRAARHGRSALLGWLLGHPSLAAMRGGGGRLACQDAAYARWPEGVEALLAAQDAVEGRGEASKAAAICLPSLLRKGVMVGDAAELDGLRKGFQPPAGVAMPLGGLAMVKSGWEGKGGEKRQREEAQSEARELEACLGALWPWMGEEGWGEGLRAAADVGAASPRPGRVAHGIALARAFAAKKEARGLEIAALPADEKSAGGKSRL